MNRISQRLPLIVLAAVLVTFSCEGAAVVAPPRKPAPPQVFHRWSVKVGNRILVVAEAERYVEEGGSLRGLPGTRQVVVAMVTTSMTAGITTTSGYEQVAIPCSLNVLVAGLGLLVVAPMLWLGRRRLRKVA
jgi:hypothetical protein